ncbi:MAG: hypothetical protein WAK17_11765, partial [Candidatus Nitrosopolaris sp.]
LVQDVCCVGQCSEENCNIVIVIFMFLMRSEKKLAEKITESGLQEMEKIWRNLLVVQIQALAVSNNIRL